MSGTPQWHKVARASDIAEDSGLQVRAADQLVAVFNIGGEFYATSDTCTHQEASLADGFVEGETIECPLHQALFHIPTGKVMGPPAQVDLKTYPVKIENESIWLQV